MKFILDAPDSSVEMITNSSSMIFTLISTLGVAEETDRAIDRSALHWFFGQRIDLLTEDDVRKYIVDHAITEYRFLFGGSMGEAKPGFFEYYDKMKPKLDKLAEIEKQITSLKDQFGPEAETLRKKRNQLVSESQLEAFGMVADDAIQDIRSGAIRLPIFVWHSTAEDNEISPSEYNELENLQDLFTRTIRE